MTSVAANVPVERLAWDRKRGSLAMTFFIVTEAMLFAALFFGYFYLGQRQPTWPPDPPPKLMLALIMLAVLLSSSGTLEWAKWNLRRQREALCRVGVGLTVALGIVFGVLQVLEYRDHLKSLTPQSDAYGSMFYTITSLHGAHVALGMLILLFVLALPRLEPRGRLPYRPFHNGSLYWHFVDGMWVLIVAILYVLPRLRGIVP
jgi:cytochrome c oxidase subunit III